MEIMPINSVKNQIKFLILASGPRNKPRNSQIRNMITMSSKELVQNINYRYDTENVFISNYSYFEIVII